MDRRELGRAAEKLAADWLSSLGYRIIEHNYTCRYGEIDLIGRLGFMLIFIEVRCRRGSNFGTPAESVTKRKQCRLYRAASFYISSKLGPSGWQVPFRFDLVEISLHDGRIHLNLLENCLERGVGL
ncbi:MAG: YraN family protein [Firmicutes bacterium]|nr:YraN family protein [Bacillota bacterium]